MWQRLAYSLFKVLALGVFLLVRRLQPWQSTKLPKRQRTALGLAAFIGGMLGAKAGFMMANLGSWSFDFVWLADGKTVLTGIACAYVAVELTKLAIGIRVKTGDDYALPLALALAVGRWGCFCNGCCFGTPTTVPWAVVFHDGLPRHPTQIYESLFHFTMAMVLFVLARKNKLPTHRLQFYLIAFCVFRFFTEYIRPEPPWFLGWTFYQWTAVAMALGLAGQWAWDERRRRPELLFPV
ncbi:MAG TPA: prolipoprotein diacylglyceryl transferase family protein [Gemmataceae bacterium]|jgi:prolipoprotein diacylglyceryltransferase|nr:prolipoprotein diacylglyceryl transferase family protein [Gemmataceae bacterium]